MLVCVALCVHVCVCAVDSRFSKLLEDNGGEWLVGSSISYADIAIFNMLDTYFVRNDAASLDGYPLLASLKERVGAQPGIAAYVAKYAGLSR